MLKALGQTGDLGRSRDRRRDGPATTVSVGRFTRRLAVAVSVIGIMTFTLVGAGSTASSASSLLQASNSGTLTFVDDALSWPSLDPASSVSEGTDNPVYSLIYGNLFTIGPAGQAVPELATGYHFSKNDLTLTLNLRPGVKFQDGTPFNSAAVKSSLERDLSPQNGCSCIPALSAISSITTPTATQDVIHLSRPDGVLIPALETSGASFVTDPTALAKVGQKAFSLNPVGAGPFKLTNNIENSSMTLTSWPGYWDAKDTHLQSVKVLSEANSSTELATMQSGTAQLLYFSQNAQEEKGALADSNLQTITGKSTITTAFVYLNPGTAPFNNKLAREALFYATDRQGLSQAVFDGFDAPTEQLIGTSMQDFPGNTLPNFPAYNAAKAKALVKQLGGLKVTLTPLNDNTSGLEQAEALEKQWGDVGIQTTINEEQFATVLAQQEKGAYQAIIAGYPQQTNGALALVGTLACKGFFEPDWCDNVVANDEKKAVAAINPEKQQEFLTNSMQQAITKDMVFLPLHQSPGVFVAAKNLKGIQIYGGYLYLGKASLG